MRITVAADPMALGREAAGLGAEALRAVLRERERAVIIVATGASQFATLAHLVESEGIDWGRVDAFHLDEYVGLPESHPASFRRFLRERFVQRLPMAIGSFEAINGEAAEPEVECRRLGELISRRVVDVAFIGIGENAHLAFNDPPADFETRVPYHVVELDEACRRQQTGEGWFPSLDDVPRQAISMSIREILRARRIICSVPDLRKAEAVRGAVEGPLTPLCPASILREHPSVDLLLDVAAASALSGART